MAFERNTQFEQDLEFKNGGNEVFEFPRGNFFSGMTLDINFDITIATGAAVTALQHQMGRAIEEIMIIRDGDNIVWQLSGEGLARLFKKKKGKEAASNLTITGATGANKLGRLTLDIPFSIIGGLKASDAAMDTNAHKYELKLKYRDVTAAGGFFADIATNSAEITINDAYISLELDKITPVQGPSGNQDSYLTKSPLFPSLMERQDTVTQTKADFKIDLPENETVHTVFMFANEETASNNWVGSNDILSGDLNLRNTQGRTIQNRKARMLREKTSQILQEGSSLENGFYIYPLTMHGNVVDSVVSDGTKPLYIKAAVTKPANNARITTITQTIEQQG